MAKTHNYFIGTWQFHDGLAKEKLDRLAQGWAEDQNYLHIYTRQIAPDKLALGFTYKPPAHLTLQEAYDTYFAKTVDYLKTHFGDDFSGWDIASRANLIKG